MSKQLDWSSMENCVCFNLRWVTRAVTQFFDAAVRRQGIHPTQTPILGALSARSGLGMAELRVTGWEWSARRWCGTFDPCSGTAWCEQPAAYEADT